MTSPSGLRQIQQWLQAVVTHPGGVSAGIGAAAGSEPDGASTVEDVVRPSRALSSVERLEIYGSAYFARLVECLRVEFPALEQALGEDPFRAFAVGYLADRPSRSYTLTQLGRGFADYLERTRPARAPEAAAPDWADGLIDLARLERTYSEVFDQEGPEGGIRLDPDELSQIPPEHFSRVRFQPYPCVRLLSLRFPVHEYATAVRRGATSALPAPRPTHLAITRREYIVRRLVVSELQSRLLASLVAGASLARALESAVESDADFDALAHHLHDWFRDWTAAPFFRSIELADD